MWRPEDDALLRRAEDELLLDIVWEQHAGVPRGAAPDAPSDRAAGIFEFLRTTESGHDLLAEALLGRAGRLIAWLEGSPVEQHPPALLHHLALYFEKVGRAQEAVRLETAASSYVRSLACFLALGAEREYLESLARRILGPQSKGVDPGAATQAFVLSRIDELAARAAAGLRAPSASSKAAMVALAQGERAVSMAALRPPYREPVVRHLSRVRAETVDAALARLTEALDAATVKNESAEARFRVLLQVTELWVWSYYDESVEIFAIERAEPLAWELRRAKNWKELRALYAKLRPLVDTFASRIEADRSKVAWAALAAQAFVFLADGSEVLAEQILLCERALAICPNHPNAKSVLAWYLATDGLERLDRGYGSPSGLQDPWAIYERARSLDPEDVRVKKLGERLAVR